MPAWVATHRPQLETTLARIGFGRFAGVLPETTAQMAWAIAVLTLLFAGVTMAIWCRPDSPVWRALYGGLLGVFLLHAGTHVAQGLLFGGYTPGLASAVLLVAPGSWWLGRRLLRQGAINLKPSAVVAAAGLLLFPPAVLIVFRFSAWLAA